MSPSPKTKLALRLGAVLGIVAVVIFVLSKLNGFYLPGIKMIDYSEGEKIPLLVSVLTSNVTHVTYDYYKLPVCSPKNIVEERRNLGDLLLGHVRQNSLYEISTLSTTKGRLLCPQKKYSNPDIRSLRDHIRQKYRVNWILDNLSVFVKVGPALFEQGFPLGMVVPTTGHSGSHVYLNNHQSINIFYHPTPLDSSSETKKVRIVGFEVEPRSIDWGAFLEDSDVKDDVISHDKYIQGITTAPGLDILDKDVTVYWTYDVNWIESEVSWRSRWELYFYQASEGFQWFSIMHALLIVFFLTAMVAMILTRTLRSDLLRYNNPDLDDYTEDYGWKNIVHDVFRPPTNPSFFSACIGSGVQIMVMIGATLIFALLGFLSPGHRNAVVTSMFVFFVLGGYAAGYSSARVYKNLGGKHWKLTTLRTATLFPGFVFVTWFVTDLILGSEGSSQSVSFPTLLLIALLWFGITVPLVYIGAFHGYSSPKIDPPVDVNVIPREIPEQPWYVRPIFALPMSGVIPFSAVFIELYFILTSLTTAHLFYMFGFITIVFIIFLIVCVEISISLVYFQFCSENYLWWWRSFLYPASSALYFLAYAVYFLITSLDLVKLSSVVTFLCYISIVTVAFGLLAGSVGFFGVYAFTNKIFSSINKFD
ncbi:hypothetical protein RCL1_008653 [Eukaryota sp. TZLM3-RCL]